MKDNLFNPLLDLKLQHDLELIIFRSAEAGDTAAELARDILAFLDVRYTFALRS